MTGIATPLQRMIAREVLDHLTAVLVLLPRRPLHVLGVRRPRDLCELSLQAFDGRREV